MAKPICRELLSALVLMVGTAAGVAAQPVQGAAVTCDEAALSASQARFEALLARQRSGSATVSADDVRAASLDYLRLSELCYQALYGEAPRFDDGGLWFGVPGADPFNTWGTKWGAGTSFTAGQDKPGPGIPGGTVTYSYMADGVDMSTESMTAGPNVAIASLPGFSACFLSDITAAFAAWSAVANIQFTQVADSGHAFNASGATGDIRIGAHTFDGPSMVLAHAFFPPPNGTTAAGDMHFDGAETWACAPGMGVLDIGIVAAHEIGHSIGLGHEPTSPTGNVALMNPFYSPANAPTVITDDINGIESIYGFGAGDLTIDFGSGIGVFNRITDSMGTTWPLLHTTTADNLTEGLPAGAEIDAGEFNANTSLLMGDLDGNGVDEIIIDFGALGIYIRLNKTSWLQLHGLNPTKMAIGDIDRNGRDDVIIDFPGAGIYVWLNHTAWMPLHTSNAEIIITADLTGDGRDEVIIDFGGAFGIYIYNHGTLAWAQLHTLTPSRMVAGDLDGNGIDDLIIDFPGVGLYIRLNNTSWTLLHTLNTTCLGFGDVDANGSDDVIIDFGPGIGLWIFRNAIGWTNIHAFTAENIIISDIDGSGRRDVVADFGAGLGLYVWLNNTSWVFMHNLSPEVMAAGDLN